MKLRIYFNLFILLFPTIIFGQNGLNYSFQGRIVDESNLAPLKFVEVKFSSTNGTDTIVLTDSLGQFNYSTNEVGNFLIRFYHKDFYNIKNYFSTVGLTKDSTFIINASLSRIKNCIMYMPVVNFNFNESTCILDSIKFSIQTFKDNPNFTFKIKGHQSKNELIGKSQERTMYVEKQLLNNGINKKRIKVFDSGTETSTNPNCIQNRCVEFEIIKTDFK